MKSKALVLAAIGLFATTFVNSFVSAQDSGWYAGTGLGRADDDLLDDKDDGVKLFGGYRFNRNVALEAGFVDLGEFDRLGVVDALSQDGIALQIVGVLPAGQRGALFAKAGFFRWNVEVSGLPDDDGTDSTYGVGGEYRFGNRWAVRAEWERFADVGGGDVDLATASLIYSFGQPTPRPRRRAAPVSKPVPKRIEVPKPQPTPAAPEEKKMFPPEFAAANRGDPNAQYKLGYMYSIGQGVPRDAVEAVKWYRQAAVQGHARAQYNLGAAYANGTGVSADKDAAVEWFFRAGQSFVREGKGDLALRVVGTIERVSPGHARANQLRAAIRRRFGQ